MISNNRDKTRRIILALSVSAFIASAAAQAFDTPAAGTGSQNWSEADRYRWYWGSQGSRLIPESWLMALEAPTSTTLFMDPANFDRFNYLPNNWSSPSPGASKRLCPPAGPYGAKLPIGFARDCQSDSELKHTKLRWYTGQKDKESWIGLNCAACHTTRITYQGQSYMIDGAPTLADFQGFTDSLLAAMQKTAADPAKWQRFADRVVVPRRPKEKDDTRVQADRAMLKTAFANLLDDHNRLDAYNRTRSVYGYARLDAVGHILNKVAYLNDDFAPIRGEPNAPVSYPFIWNAPQHDFVQWNGLVPNKKIKVGLGITDGGALVRNTSEVIGVFADVVTRQKAGLKGYKSSVDVANLIAMEDQLARLMSPQWPAAFGTPDPTEVEYGKRLFKEACAGCHLSLDRTDLKTPVIAQMTPIWDPAGVKTDPWMACNTFAYVAKGGVLTGTKDSIFDGPPLPAQGPTAEYLKTQAIGTLLNQKFKILWIVAKRAIGNEGKIEVFEEEAGVQRQPPADQPLNDDQRLKQCIDAAKSAAPDSDAARTLAYKARPLNGIWATGPYLHNGSVRSLYDLLLTPAKRPTRFWVGNREFDPKHVGYVSKAEGYGSWFDVRNNGGFGNSNAGHDYGNARFDEKDRMALVAYMKTL